MLNFEGKEIETDNDGYLKESGQWSEALAEVIAEKEGITLSPEHWEVVRFVREFYLEFNTSPAIRMLVKAMANTFGEEKATAVICTVCSRKARPSRRPKLPACQNR
ncbi:TusE/DsrC/DsvC family sulfur relay protein [Enterobacter cancerogenus]|uniref:Sulfurtransferase TusE n=1 Tax=Enterobacter cancerogenus TaxID=69218 RepID=A0A484XAT0_9ENTR|nr:TusE/DsrC/DsvC family sulfur relay protein [Enterobacter cancerogenus]